VGQDLVKLRTSIINRISFLIPGLILVIIFVIYPIVGTIMLSFNINPIPGVDVVKGRPVGVENYYKVLTSYKFINPRGLQSLSFPMGAIIHNIIWIALHLPLTMLLGLLLATLLLHVKGDPSLGHLSSLEWLSR